MKGLYLTSSSGLDLILEYGKYMSGLDKEFITHVNVQSYNLTMDPNALYVVYEKDGAIFRCSICLYRVYKELMIW